MTRTLFRRALLVTQLRIRTTFRQVRARTDASAFRCLLTILIASGVWAVPVLADPEYADGELIVGLRPGASIETINTTYGTTVLAAYQDARLYLLSTTGLADTQIEALKHDPDVRYADANYASDTPEGVRQLVIIAVGGEFVDYEDQALTERIGLDPAHLQATGAGTTIAFLDTGVDPAHPALQGRLVAGYDFVDDDPEPWEVTGGLDDDGDGQFDEGYGHGTMVAGILALVAPDAVLLPIRVLDDDGRADAFAICEGIQFAVRHGADVLNLSLGVAVEMESIARQLEYAKGAEVVVVAAAGNENRSSPPYYPAAEGSCVMVTAVDSFDVKADFADWGSKVDICAPGTGVRSAFPGGGWALGSGCSFATPLVAGTVALVKSIHPGLDGEHLREQVLEAVQGVDLMPANISYQGGLGSGRLYVPFGLMSPADVEGPAGIAQTASSRLWATPNPAAGAVTIRWEAPGAGGAAAYGDGLDDASPVGSLRARILTASGRHVTWIERSHGQWVWDGRDGRGRLVAAGRYLARVQIGSGSASTWLTVLR